ncbi:hypothetical protein RHMOL_Rhmol07G0157800 [Rhododendron molle]|uniref:Uncharacterized protein n=1 Tax=Rhododendron molle TaxID=49168 RepID=A0ACC0N190_RHOML|nr:hypothetical protein RHMOL_Rhmol07G0157800 [Rhododendron molle]
MIADWEEFEAANFQRNDEPLFEAGWEIDWQNIHADPLDGFSLYALFENQGEEYQIFQDMPEWGWDPTPDEYQLLAWNDPLDTFSLPALLGEEYQLGYPPEIMTYNWPELAPLHPDFSHFNDFVINNLYNNVNLTPYPNLPEFEVEVASNGFDPMDYLVDGTESEPSVTFPKDADVTMINLWEDEPGVGTNLWANTEVVNIRVGNEEWTVNKTVMEAEK